MCWLRCDFNQHFLRKIKVKGTIMNKDRVSPVLKIRKATIGDMKEIESVMKCSMEILGQGHYTPEQVLSSIKYVCVPDSQIIEDGTYYVVEDENNRILACGGWSFRNKLYAGPNTESQKDDRLDPKKDKARIRAMFFLPNISSKGLGTLILKTSEDAAKEYGFSQGALGATQSGLAFYKAKGWTVVKEDIAELPDGVNLQVTQMEKDR
jgi:GNAT superfamily N-acetyltransferase